MQQFAPYLPAILAMAATALLFLTQLLVVDFAGIKARHKPGTPVDPDSGSFHFRATRAHANTNESISAFALLAIASVLISASPTLINSSAWIYFACRAAHMIAYYANLPKTRSIAFGLSVVPLLVMFAAIMASILA